VVSVQPQPGTGGRREDVIPPVVTARISPRGDTTEETYAILYYPGETSPLRAQPIDVPAGATLGPVDFSLRAARMRAFHVRGTAVNTITGKPATGAQLRIAPREWTSTVLMPTATVDSNGNFDIRGVIPGEYVLYANQAVPNPAAPPPAPGGGPRGTPPANAGAPAAPPLPPIPLSARLPLNVGNGDIDNLRLALVQGNAVTGRVLIDGSPGVEIPRGIAVSLAREPDLVGVLGPQGGAAVQPDGRFMLQNIGSGEYRVYVAPYLAPFRWNAPATPAQLQNGYVKSIRQGGRDVLTGGFVVTENASAGEVEIVLGPGGRINGSAVNDRREPLANATVALIPELSLRRRTDLYRTAVTDISGRFQIQGAAPGRYQVFAWESVERDAWMNAEFMRPIEGRGVTVEIREGAVAGAEVVAIR
jgi:hypothetical protein